MKKLLLIPVILLLASAVSRAQEPTESKQKKYVYCELVREDVFRGTRVRVDFGDSIKVSQNKKLMGDNGKLVDPTSLAAAANYLAEEGWELAYAYVLKDSEHWILKKEAAIHNEPTGADNQ